VTNESFTGGYAQYAVASLGSIARKPESLNFIEAASAPVVAVTAWQMLFDRASVSAGQTVLVLGARGNVGSYAAQMANWAGARVIEISGPDDARQFAELAGSVDAVIDTVGREVQASSLVTLKKGGIIVSSVSAPSPDLALRYEVRAAFFIVHVPTAQLERVAQLFDAAKIKPNVGVVLGISDARRAHEMLAGTVPHPQGKIVLRIGDGATNR
ncbi:MAG: NADP-dependent oxidoreductase, partial [Candidatus Eremiobacteraeota bacterium]|nr:NADP-dependent oxidoreductase [Candidatus Eremiobacteraeota bacterium]